MKILSRFFGFFGFLLLVQPVSAAPPARPSNGGASSISSRALSISWEDNSDNEAVFGVFAYVDGQVVNPALQVLAQNTTSTVISGVSPGASVQYAIFAFNSSNENSQGILTPTLIMPDDIIRFGHQAIVGQAFSEELASDGLNRQSSATVTGLPNGVAFDAATRTLSFTPTESGEFSVDLEVNYSDGFSINETIPIRILPAASAPVEMVSLPSLDYYPNAGVQTLDLSVYFEDPDCSSAVRMTYGLGVIDIILYEAATPATVANFLDYVNGSGQEAYDGSFIHRVLPNFVIQGGGYRPIGDSEFESVTDLSPVVNEPGLENVRGTLSMAKLGGDPNSATNEWFVSLADNRSNLDFQNSGFSVFGRVAGTGMTVVDSIAGLPTGTYNAITVDSAPRPGLLSNCPMTAATAPATMEQDKLVAILSAAEVAPLNYTVVSNSDATVAMATIDDGSLQITPLAVGTCTIRIRVTDLDNNVIERDVTVAVSWTFADWIEAADLTLDQGPLDDTDGDGFNNFLEYNLFGDVEISNRSLSQRAQVSHGAPTAEDYLAIEFITRRGIKDTIIYVEAIDELSAIPIWTEIWNSTQGASDVQVQSSSVGTESVDWLIRDKQAIEDSTTRFIRVRAVISD